MNSAATAPRSDEAGRIHRMSLRQQVMSQQLPPQPTATHKRLMDQHVTAYPGLLNTNLLPPHALAATDFHEIDPTLHRKNHSVRNNNVSSSEGMGKKDTASVPMMTTKQMAARLTEMGTEMRRKNEKYRARVAAGEEDVERDSDIVDSAVAMGGKGYYTNQVAPPYDDRSTYRFDYCQQDPDGNQDAARQFHLANYRNDWTTDDCENIDRSMKCPYLTQPESYCKDRSTVYRVKYMPEAGRQEYRLLHHGTNLPELGTTFAYSAYAYDDPRRTVTFDASVSALKDPHSVLEKTHSPRDSFYIKGEKKGSSVMDAMSVGLTGSASPSHARNELDRLRALRRETIRRSVEKRESRTSEVQEETELDKKVVMPGVKGSGYRCVPNNQEDYIYLPRDHFCPQSLED